MIKIHIVLGDITALDCDCIVNAANPTLLGGGGVDGAIHAAAGKGLLEECRTLGGCRTGEAKITGGYALKAKYVIHTVGPVYGRTTRDKELLADCYVHSLDLTKSKGIRSIAFPAISTGVYGYPAQEAAEIAVRSVREWSRRNKEYDLTVIFCCFDENTFRIYHRLECGAAGEDV